MENEKAYQLKLELVDRNGLLPDDVLATLKKYGKVKKTLSRTILVPGDMTLYALHYAIQKCFGWQNSHLHHFAYDDETFKVIAGDNFRSWKKYCGLVFRGYYDDDDLYDVYWNDDYCEGRNFNTWLKRKYTRPYYYGGSLELYMIAQENCKRFEEDNEQIKLPPSFVDYLAGKKEGKIIDINDATVEELRTMFQGGFFELLERLTISEVFGLPTEIENNRKNMESVAEKEIQRFYDIYNKWCDLEDEYKIVGSESITPRILPLTDILYYEYDYGDGWCIKITCEEIINVELEKPVGLKVDGRNVLDDVGGIYGYCEFLRSVYEPGFEGEGLYSDKESSLEWAKFFGWNGRMKNAKNLL